MEGILDFTFEELLYLYFKYHFVFSSPTAFCLLRFANKDADLELIRNPLMKFNENDCLFCEQVAGNLIEGFKELPDKWKFEKDFIVIERKKKKKIYSTLDFCKSVGLEKEFLLFREKRVS